MATAGKSTPQTDKTLRTLVQMLVSPHAEVRKIATLATNGLVATLSTRKPTPVTHARVVICTECHTAGFQDMDDSNGKCAGCTSAADEAEFAELEPSVEGDSSEEEDSWILNKCIECGNGYYAPEYTGLEPEGYMCDACCPF